jgi:predicted phage tail protein
MNDLLSAIGLASGELTQIIILAVVLVVGLFLVRVVFKLTATLFRVGCFAILFIVGAVFVLNLLN